MSLPRAFTFTTNARFRALPVINILKTQMNSGKKGWILELGWLKLKIDIYNLESWNALCAQFNDSLKKP